MDQNILLNKLLSFGDSYYCSDKCNILIDCATPLKVMHRNVQGDNDKSTNSTYPKNFNHCNTRCINQYEQPYHCNRRCINLYEKAINAQKYHTKCTENPMIPSSNVNDCKFVKENIKNCIDLNSGNSTKDFTITSSSSDKSYKNCNTGNSLNVKSYRSRDVQENRKIPQTQKKFW